MPGRRSIVPLILDFTSLHPGQIIAILKSVFIFCTRPERIVMKMILLAMLLFTVDLVPQYVLYWDRTWGSPKRVDEPYYLTRAADGNIIVAGVSSFYSPAFQDNFFILKFSPNGEILWSKVFDFNEPEDPIGLHTDGESNIYIGMVVTNHPTNRGFSMVKLSSDGELLFTKRYTYNPGNEEVTNTARHLMKDNSEYFYIAGVNKKTAWHLKFDQQGEVVDSMYSFVPADSLDDVTTFKHFSYLSPGDQRIYHGVSTYRKQTNSDYRIGIAAVDNHGSFAWKTNVYTVPEYYEGWTEIIAQHPEGAIYTATNAYQTNTLGANFAQCLVTKLDPGGVTLWQKNFEGPIESVRNIYDMKFDAGGFTIVTGQIKQFFITKLSQAGEEQWYRADTSLIRGMKIATDAHHNVYVAAHDRMGNLQFVRYNSDGQEMYRYQINGLGSYRPVMRPLVLGSGDATYYLSVAKPVALVPDHDVNLVKLTDPATKVYETGNPEEFVLYPNYPNPFNPVTTVTYSLPKPGLITFSVFTILGEQVFYRDAVLQDAGVHSLAFDGAGLPSGMYIGVVSHSTLAEKVRKQIPMILVK